MKSPEPLTVAWITFFPVEWLPGLPPELSYLQKGHPAGWQRVLLEELRHDPALRLHVFVIRRQFQRDHHFEWNSVQFHCLRATGGLRAPSLYWLDTWLLRRHIKKIQPDVIHAWGTEQAAALVASRLGRPYLVTMQGIFSWLKDRVPLNRHHRFSAWLESWSLRRAPLVTTEARFAVDFLGARFPGLRIEQIEHAPDPVFSSTPRKPQAAPRRFLNIGAPSELKGSDLLFRALASLTGEIDFTLTVLGSGEAPLVAALRRELPAAFWERVKFRTHLTAAEVAEEMSASSLLIYPTRGDTSPNAVKEAVVHGLPVVAAEVGGIPDYVRHGVNGLFFSSGDLGALISAIRAAVAHTDFREGRVPADALAAARDYLSPRTMAQKFRAAYDTLAAR